MKRLFALFMACLVSLTCTVTAFAAAGVAKVAFTAFLDWVIDNVIDDLSDGAWDLLKDSVDSASTSKLNAHRSAVLSCWKGIINHFNFTEDDFSDYYNKLIEDYTYVQSQAAAGIPVSSLDDPDYYYKVLDAYNLIYEGMNISSTESGMNLVDPYTIWSACQSSDVVAPDNNGKPRIPSSDFKDLVEERKNIYKYFPTGSMAVASFKNDVLYSGSEYDNVRTVSYFTFLADKNFFGFSGLHECYVVPFVMSDEKGYYFSPYCYKLSQNMTLNDGHGNSAIIDMIFSKVELTGSELSDYDYYTSQFDEESNIIWKLSDDPLLDGGSSFDFMKNYPFLVLDPYQNETILHYCNYFDYVKHSVSTQYGFSHYFKFFNGFFTSSSGVSSLNVLSQFPFGNYRFYMPVDEVPFDFGFYVSTSPILMNGFAADIDTQRIPDNYYITVGGDTIYNYTITDPATGQSDTVNNYVTNNYTFVDTGDEGGSSGSVGGNVTVGGQIDVSGKVDVGVDVNVNVPDININVNGGAGGSVPDTEVDTNPLDEYLTSAIDDSSGVRQFFGSFFDFVPPEIVVLLGIGLTFVIMGRILGR